jgi:Serine carboxypeptidase
MLKLIKQGVYVVMYTGDADYNCNWLGGEAVSKEIGAPGFSSAGYTNITTSDKIVHGQVKQSEEFAFVRIYESGHEVPFYQPLVSLEMFDRVINGKDIETGKTKLKPGKKYLTKGTAKSTYREGNSTIQPDLVDTDCTYNTTTNAPNPCKSSSDKRSLEKRTFIGHSTKLFKPVPKGRSKR